MFKKIIVISACFLLAACNCDCEEEPKIELKSYEYFKENHEAALAEKARCAELNRRLGSQSLEHYSYPNCKNAQQAIIDVRLGK